MPEEASAIRAPFAPLTRPKAGAARNAAVKAHSGLMFPGSSTSFFARACASLPLIQPLAAPPAATKEYASISVLMWGPCGKGFPPRDLARRDRSALFERSRLSIFFFELGSGVYARRALRVFLFRPRRVLRAVLKASSIKGAYLK